MDEQSLLAAICDEPDDDARRLVYADWLEEHGDSRRAEFIRLSLELDRMEPGSDPREDELIERAIELEGELEAPPPFPGITWGADELGGAFVRGLPAVLTADDPWDLLEALPELQKFAPLERIRLKALDSSGAASLAEWPGLRHVVALSLNGADLDDDSLAELASSPHWRRLAHLDLCNADFNSNLRWLAAAPGLTGLKSLQMSYCYAHDPMMRTLAGIRHLPNLRSLHLGGVRNLRPHAPHITDEGVRHLAGSPHFRLTTLYIHGNGLTDEGVRLLVGAPWAGDLGLLYLSHNRITDEGARALAESPLRRGCYVAVYGNQFTGAGRQILENAFDHACVEDPRTRFQAEEADPG